eukprot:TRINITY_DN25111_c0_g1_i1.p1 TRINITY_DN25111_c0_g1~~TRINITY_DN25111_c0_g1_i1.p1  ORF type:complete len:982 (+),score=188.65 TRINITY_DN25111_c0_g1_i1:252-3197(+)
MPYVAHADLEPSSLASLISISQSGPPAIGSDSEGEEPAVELPLRAAACSSSPAPYRPEAHGTVDESDEEGQHVPVWHASQVAREEQAVSVPARIAIEAKPESPREEPLEEFFGSPRERMLAELKCLREEEARVRVAYDAEVARAADLRAALEGCENSASALEELKGELAIATEELAEITLNESRHAMRLEDDAAFCRRQIENLQVKTEALKHQAKEDEEECRRLHSGGPVNDSEVEEALRRADREASELRQDVERREKAIAQLNSDLANTLEYMIRTNIRAAGGPSCFLTSEDFLPSEVRAHLGLGRYGEDILKRACRRFENEMSRLKSTQDEEAPGLAWTQDRARHDTDSAESPRGAPGPESQEVIPAPLVAAEVEDVDSLELWMDLGGDGYPAERSHEVAFASRPAETQIVRSVNLEEEGKLLREGLASELQRLTDVMAMASKPQSTAHGPYWELLVAVARDDVEAVKNCLQKKEITIGDSSCSSREHTSGSFGWTAWHLAAVHGHCGLLACMKEDMVERGTHHRAALGAPTAGLGLPPFAVACLAGHLDAARSLLQGMAPVHTRDARGNTPLLWAEMAGFEKEIVPLLLAAKADPEVMNSSGLRASVKMLCAPVVLPVTSSSAMSPLGEASPLPIFRPEPDATKPYHLIKASALDAQSDPSFLTYTLGMLKAPVRDSLGFGKKPAARKQAQLSHDEEATGFWSDFVTNFTHGGLSAALAAEGAHADPANWVRSRQAFVLTCERVLLFNARSWSLEQVIALSELAEVSFSSHCSTVLILRMHRNPDIVLDLSSSSRGRLIEELQLATNAVNSKWGGDDFGGGLRVLQECEPISELFDENRRKVGVLAWVEASVFLLLPYVPTSMLFANGDCFFFGQLDLHQQVHGAEWAWRTYFFVLKNGRGDMRKLLWCRRPTDELCAGSVLIRDITAVQPLDTPSGEVCLIVDYNSGKRAELLTLRATSVQSREDWIVSIRTMQIGA